VLSARLRRRLCTELPVIASEAKQSSLDSRQMLDWIASALSRLAMTRLLHELVQ